MYYIVEFIESREVEVVPALWVNNDVCQWPDHHRSTELKKSIKNKEQPGPSWDAFSVRILYTAENYQTARLKLPQAENHTDLQTAEEDEDDIPKRKRKRLSNIRFESDSDSDNDAFHKKTNSVFNNLPPPPKINGPGFEVQAAVNNQALTRKPHNHRRPTSLGYTSTPVSRQSSTTPNVSSPIARGSMSSPEPRHLEHNRLSSANEFITALSVIGGVDIKDSVWRIMKRCLTNALAKQLNWRGVNGKTAFQRLGLKDVISRTVRNNILTKAATDQEIDTFIKRWLHLAGDRDGGRRKREERRQAVQNSSLEDTHGCGGPRRDLDQDGEYAGC
ncbi:uncharacterized protein LOC112137831 [Oryzias melastigma]|uniref:uncharacterized protein LOC112137831 n=1 Tax=Oryzias melastigma TaxID=30732 RepID=UPI000CF7E849|nr:uncharacterized protein LOC112137831 [Oryzias melastigma]